MTKTLYDHPKWYDLVYGSDWKSEFEFLLGSFKKHGKTPTRSVFEPACGTGRLLYRLAKRGFAVGGNDLNELAVDYCNRRLVRHGLRPTAVVGDMCKFTLARPVDAAFNLVSSFRHIVGLAKAQKHLKCMAECIKPGGIYLLGFHLTPTAADSTDCESWSATRGHLTVNTTMRLVERDWDKRIELFENKFDVYTPTNQQSIREIIKFQMYTKDDFLQLLNKVPRFEVVETYDFHFDLNEPVPLSDQVEDTVFVLKRI